MALSIEGIYAIAPYYYEEGKTWESHGKMNDSHFELIEPDYKSLIPSMKARRMSKMVKMGLFSGLKAMEIASWERVDSILSGTGLGCLTDTERFLINMIEEDEGLLNPTAFIQSTHNTIAAQLALWLKCTGENMTYVQRSASFVNALVNSELIFSAHPEAHILAGAQDELTPKYYSIASRSGIWKRNANISEMEHPESHGGIAGEGAAMLALKKAVKSNSTVKILSFEHQFGEMNDDQWNLWIYTFLKNAGIKEPDWILSGNSGDVETDHFYDRVRIRWPENSTTFFKKWTGDFHCADALAVHIAWAGLSNGLEVPLIAYGLNNTPSTALIYNQQQGLNHQLILLG